MCLSIYNLSLFGENNKAATILPLKKSSANLFITMAMQKAPDARLSVC
jgi:hypothetical protein